MSKENSKIDKKYYESAKMVKRRLLRGEEKFSLVGQEVTVNPYKTWYKTNGDKIASFSDGEAAIQEISYGKGKILIFSTSIGYSYKVNREEGWLSFKKKYITENVSILPKKYSDGINNIHHQTLYTENGTIEIIQNYSQEIIEIKKASNMEILTEQNCFDEIISLNPTDVICFISKNKS